MQTCILNVSELLRMSNGCNGEYGEMQKGWTADDAKGFIKVLSTPLRVYYANHKDEQI